MFDVAALMGSRGPGTGHGAQRRRPGPDVARIVATLVSQADVSRADVSQADVSQAGAGHSARAQLRGMLVGGGPGPERRRISRHFGHLTVARERGEEPVPAPRPSAAEGVVSDLPPLRGPRRRPRRLRRGAPQRLEVPGKAPLPSTAALASP